MMDLGTRIWSHRSLTRLGNFQSTSEKNLDEAAERHGLLRGLRRGKKKKELLMCAGFWTAATAALYWVPAQQ